MNETCKKSLPSWVDSLIQNAGRFNLKPNDYLATNCRTIPACDIYESGDCFFAILDVPGYNKTNIKVEVKENEIHLTGLANKDPTKCYISELILSKLKANSVSDEASHIFDSDHDQSGWTKHFSEREPTFQGGWYRKLFFPQGSLANYSKVSVYIQLGILIVIVPKWPRSSPMGEIPVEGNLEGFLSQSSVKKSIDVFEENIEKLSHSNSKSSHTVSIFGGEEEDSDANAEIITDNASAVEMENESFADAVRKGNNFG